jgi:hypothetical protein
MMWPAALGYCGSALYSPGVCGNAVARLNLETGNNNFGDVFVGLGSWEWSQVECNC